MSRDLTLLEPAFRTKVEATIAACLNKGVIVRPFFTLRTPKEQAKLWRQSRTKAQVERGIQKLRDGGATYLASVLEKVGPVPTQGWATNALPGLSWHNWGLAVDCFVEGREGEAIWDSTHQGYATYASMARKQGLTAGYFWEARDAVHIQSLSGEVETNFNLRAIDAEMVGKFS